MQYSMDRFDIYSSSASLIKGKQAARQKNEYRIRMLAISSSSLTPNVHGLLFQRLRHSLSSELYRPRTIFIEKPSVNVSYGFSLQTYGLATLNISSTNGSATSLASSSVESTTSRKSSTSNSLCSSSQLTPIQLVTYVDHVQDKSPAWLAGLRAGSVILSVNDHTVENDDHETLIKRISQTSSSTQLKLVVIQQNINQQIRLCEQLQQLHKELHEKEEELEELCRQERNIEEDLIVKTKESSIQQHGSISAPERTMSFCHDKIPLDWRQSVADFAHQQKFVNKTMPTTTTTSKYAKNRPCLNSTTYRQRSMSLSTIVVNYSKSSLRRYQSPVISQQHSNYRRALSHENLFLLDSTKGNSHYLHDVSNYQQDDSMIASGCSLAMDLSRSFSRKDSSSSSSSTTIHIDENDSNQNEKLESNKIKHFKWKLKINK